LLSSCARQTSGTGSAAPAVWQVQVKNAVRAGDGDASLRALREFVLEHPKDLAARRQLAARFLTNGHRDLAIEHLRIAEELAPGDEAVVLELARQLAAEGFKEEADRTLTRYRHGAAASAIALSYAAILKDELGALEEGEALHRAALAKAPRNARLENNLAFNLASQKKAIEAERIYQTILVAHPSFEAARNNLARLYATQLKRPEEALLHWKAAGGPAIAHNNLAAVYIEERRWEDARAELEKALKIRFQFPEAQQNLRMLAASTGGTVQLNLARDKESRGLSKLAKAFRHAFVSEEEAAAGAKR
jgi:Flp pilus assembly protein TadD